MISKYINLRSCRYIFYCKETHSVPKIKLGGKSSLSYHFRVEAAKIFKDFQLNYFWSMKTLLGFKSFLQIMKSIFVAANHNLVPIQICDIFDTYKVSWKAC